MFCFLPSSAVDFQSDGSKTTGCFDLLCSGFVQTSTTVALGAAINPVSSKFGPQYEIPVSIYMVPILN